MSTFKRFAKKALYKTCGVSPAFAQKVFEVESVENLREFYGWPHHPLQLDEESYRSQPLSTNHLNNRRLLDARVLATVAVHEVKTAALEIGTSTGISTTLLAENAPGATIYTVDIPRDSPNPGNLITHKLSREEIGRHYKTRGCGNVVQILEDTATWQPELPTALDMAFIDGCHDTRYIINDTLKVLPLMRQHGFLIWHDFNPRLTHQFPWLNKVIAGVKALYAGGHLSQPTLYLRNSFTAVHRL